ncbi:nucleoside-diphosphate kinase [Paenibacillus aurantius]|uniref:nucleoside-diphosphate kinase n=1 Tax=Paenibacillus aurantius TaxID=2918900 RepID=A0AA96LDE2_9BACL|nr:nucleoside-diphosphate kinase [Paenibacillus aurantius]WNQ09662.1 nucleoside-diphosphate kinase [Paenibacillus aurantius]
MIKPDAVERKLIYPILNVIFEEGLCVCFISERIASSDLIFKHYQEHLIANNDIEKRLREYYVDKTVVLAIIKGDNAINRVRKLIGSTDPSLSSKESIRGKWGMDSFLQAEKENRSCRNLIHSADSLSNAIREIKIWFPEFNIHNFIA